MDVQTLLDRQAISDLIALYSRGLDRIDEATLRSIYHEDAIEDRGEGLFIGRAQDWVDWTLTVLPLFSATQHGILQSLIDVEGDIAYGETYFQAYHRFADTSGENPDANAFRLATAEDVSDELVWPEGDTEVILAGRYLDRFEKRRGIWKIAYRKMICDWCRTQSVADDWFVSNPTAYRGVRSIADSRLDWQIHKRPS